LAVVSGSTLLVFALMVFWPQAPDETTSVTDVKVMTNKFTQVILDGKQAKARKQAAEQARQSMQRTEVKVSGRVQATVPKSASLTNTKGPRASVQIDKQLQAAGLGRLIGKIAKRRAPAGVFVAGQGVAAGSRPSGMVSNSVSGTIADAGRAGVKGGTGLFKLGGASTSGRAGGETGYMGSAGLGGAGVGSGSVGVLEEESDVQGGLAREVIARVIAENIGHIRYCYERQLSANPELYGKVLVKFTIGAAGSVDAQSIGTSTLNNANVEGCILRRVSGWKFPKPAGGTSVLVSYPFLFKSTN
jgi:outer membrane biosynthesis protein TonB